MYIEDKEKARASKLKIILYLLLVVSAVLGIAFFFMNDGGETMVNTLLRWAIILLFIGIVAAVALPVLFRGGKIERGHVSDKKSVGLYIILGFVACGILAYLLPGGGPVELSQSVEAPSKATLVMTDTLLHFAIILLVVAICAALLGSLFKSRS